MRRNLLLLLFLCLFALNVEAFSIDRQVAEIQKQTDKSIVISQLNALLSNNSLSHRQRINILMVQCRSYLIISDLQKALTVIKEAQTLAKQENLSLQQAQIDKLIGIVYYYQGDYDNSLPAYKSAITYYRAQPFTPVTSIKIAHLLNNIALVQTVKGDSFSALTAYQEADSLYQQFGDEVDKIDVRYNLAVLYISLRRYDIAITMLDDVIDRRKVLNDEQGVAKASGDLGVAYKYSGQYEQAEHYAFEALTYFETSGNQFDAASQLHNIAEINYELYLMDKAFSYATLGVELSKKIGHKMTYAGSLQTLAKISYYQGNINQSRDYVEQSNAVANEMGFQRLLTENLGLMSLIYAAEQNSVEALKSQLSYHKSRLKLSNDRLNEQLAQFESDQLNQQVKNLQQSKQLQELELTKAAQLRQFIVVGVAFLLLILFLIYRRYLERHLTKELEQRVKQRTEALEFLTKELQDANMVKSQFLANMSHEIRTPLTAVLGQAEAIIHGDFDDDSIIKEVSVIHSNSLHLLQLINDILDLSKIEANKFELDNRQQDLHDIVEKLSDMFEEQAHRKNLSFTITHQLPQPFIIDVDGLRLKQILINLCSNAIKFTSEGWVSLDIAIINKTLLFTITDTGIGMSDEQMSKVFNIFTQGDNSISRRFSGSGLGLFLSDQLAKVMSGTITVTSQLNHGSTFELKLPFGEIYPALTCTQINECELVNRTQENQFVGTILLADDHDDNRRLIARLLARLGLGVIEASNGIEAVELCLKHQPTLILLDIQMPKMDGIEALNKLKELGCNQPIYALTANAMSHEIAQYLSLGFAGHLKKPIEREVFVATITKHYTKAQCSSANELVVNELVVNDGLVEPNNIVSQPLNNTSEHADFTIEMSDLLQSFIHSLPQTKEEILHCRYHHDTVSLAKSAHKISGAAQMFGFSELSQSAAELEQAIKKQNTMAIDDLTYCLLDEITFIQHQNKLV